jgi:hypothetical protein
MSQKKLQTFCRDPANYQTVCALANKLDGKIAPWLILSVVRNVSYDKLEFHQKYGRIPISRTAFYNMRRLFFDMLAGEVET